MSPAPLSTDTGTPCSRQGKWGGTGRIIELARSQVGVKFMHQGRLPGQYLDCAGLVAYIAAELGAPFNEWPGYGRTPHHGLLESVLDGQPCLNKVGAQSPAPVAPAPVNISPSGPTGAGLRPNWGWTPLLPGDILLMRFGREPQHIAVCAGDTVIHSYEAVGQVCEHDLDALWLSRITGIYRFVEPRLITAEA